MKDAPGGTTGLLVRKVKKVGRGANAQFAECFELDTGILNQLRALEAQAALDLGQLPNIQ
jgi:hypothetical protein